MKQSLHCAPPASYRNDGQLMVIIIPVSCERKPLVRGYIIILFVLKAATEKTPGTLSLSCRICLFKTFFGWDMKNHRRVAAYFKNNKIESHLVTLGSQQ